MNLTTELRKIIAIARHSQPRESAARVTSNLCLPPSDQASPTSLITVTLL